MLVKPVVSVAPIRTWNTSFFFRKKVTTAEQETLFVRLGRSSPTATAETTPAQETLPPPLLLPRE